MNYREQNNKTIDDVFARLRVGADMSIQNGMVALLNAGVDYCLEEHINNPPHAKNTVRIGVFHSVHVERGGYGWVLMHNGTEVQRRLYGTDAELRSNADSKLSLVQGKAPKEGWSGIILASLEPETYYQVMYEFIPMRAAMKDIAHLNFDEYFKPVKI